MRSRLMLGVACAALACSGGDGQPDAAGDAGADAFAVVDVGQDTAPFDVGIDADAALAPDDPGWVRLPGFPEDCYVERARQPGAVLAFHWEACPDGIAGCQMTVVDRSAAPLERTAVINGGNDLLHVIAFHLYDGVLSYNVISRNDVVVAAWRDRTVVGGVACFADVVASRDGIAVNAVLVGPGDAGSDFISVASWGDLSTLESPVWTSTPTISPDDVLQTPSTSATTFAGTLLSGRILVVEPPSATIFAHGDLGPVVVGRTVLWNWFDGAGATAIHAARIGGTETELYRPPVGSSVYGVRSDGQWITWRAQIAGASPPFHELWVAPYAETGPLDPRHLWDDVGGGGYDGTIGDGMYAYVGRSASGNIRVAVVDLADGSRRSVELPDSGSSGDGWAVTSDPSWVTRDEVAFPATRTSGSARLVTVLRFDIRGSTIEPFVGPTADAGI